MTPDFVTPAYCIRPRASSVALALQVAALPPTLVPWAVGKWGQQVCPGQEQLPLQ